jgi:MYXO-CTERM domain-containing protein
MGLVKRCGIGSIDRLVGPTTNREKGAVRRMNSKLVGTFATFVALLSVGATDARAEFMTDCVEKVAPGSLGDVTYVNVSMGLDSKKVSKQILGALYQVYLAAQSEGITLKLASAFRTSEEQKYLWNCYQGAVANGCKNEPIFWSDGICLAKYCPPGCSSCNLAASPGTSNHESGLAIDIHTKSGTNDAYKWLSKDEHKNSKKFGFFPIDAEPWHFDYKGTTPWADPCGGAGSIWQSVCNPEAVAGAENETFKDMPPGMFGKKEAEALLVAGITKGCSQDLFCPDCLTTRAMAVTFLIRAAGVEVGGQPVNPTFVDVDPGAYYAPYVEKAAELGIVSGCMVAEKKFCPDEPATRAEFIKMLIATLDVPLVTPNTPTFVDVPKGSWAYSYAETALELCITTGCSPTEFCPEDSTTRAMAAVFITRAFDLLDANDCVSYCDAAKCEASNYCDPWSVCAFDGVCSASGAKERECSTYACKGPKTDAVCEETVVMETDTCEQETDGLEVVGWSEWGACMPTEPCSADGSQERTRTVCADGGPIKETETQGCTPAPDPNCPGSGQDDVVEPDVSPEPDAGPVPDTGTQSDAQTSSDVGSTVGNEPDAGKPIVPEKSGGSGESSGCAADRNQDGLNIVGLLLLSFAGLLFWRRSREREDIRA